MAFASIGRPFGITARRCRRSHEAGVSPSRLRVRSEPDPARSRSSLVSTGGVGRRACFQEPLHVGLLGSQMLQDGIGERGERLELHATAGTCPRANRSPVDQYHRPEHPVAGHEVRVFAEYATIIREAV